MRSGISRNRSPALLDGYTVEQRETILHFCTKAARRQEEATAKLAAD
jgi:hypothetical protein